MARKKEIEPAVKITRVCKACGERYILPHPNDPRLYCEKCMEALAQVIKERRGL